MMKNRIVIGLTGQIGTGKSSVSKYLLTKGFQVIDTDKLVHEILDNDERVINKLGLTFGTNIIENNSINRKKLGSIVFSDDKKLKLLNSLIHPIVHEYTCKMIEKSNEQIIFLDVPLLFETNFYKLCDYTVCVYAPKHIQISRIQQRDKSSVEMINKQISSQMPLIDKINKSDYIIDNSKTLEMTYKQVDEILERVKKQCHEE